MSSNGTKIPDLALKIEADLSTKKDLIFIAALSRALQQTHPDLAVFVAALKKTVEDCAVEDFVSKTVKPEHAKVIGLFQQSLQQRIDHSYLALLAALGMRPAKTEPSGLP